MPKTTDSTILSVLDDLNVFYWKINLSDQTITLDETIKNIFGNNFKESISINDFLNHINPASKVNFKEKLSAIENNTDKRFSINILIDSENTSINIFLNGKINKQNRSIIEGIGQPTDKKAIYNEQDTNLEATILENAPVMIGLTDIKGVITYINPNFSKVTGYSANELIGKSSRILQSGFHKKDFYKNLWETILEGEPWEGKMLNRKKNGDVYWEKAIIAPYYDKNSNFKGFIKASEDISVQEAYKKQLQAERNLFLAGPVIVLKWNTDINGEIIYTSPNVIDVLGYSADEFINDIDFIEIIHPDDRAFIVEETKEHIDKNTNVSFKQSYRLKTKAGKYKHFIDHTSIERDDNNQIINFSGYLIDNTEYIEAQEELKKNESKYRDVFNTAGVGIIYTTKEGIIVDANRKFGELVFSEHGELIGKSAMELLNKSLPGKSTKELLPVLFHILKGNRIDPKEIHIENRYYELQSDYNPDLQTNIGILRDITEQKTANQKVKKSEQKYKYLVDHMNDGLVITNKNEELTFMNEASKRIFEGDIESFDNKRITDFATPTSKDIIYQQEKLRRQGESATYYIEIITKNGSKKNIEVSASPTYKDSKYNGSFGILRDITEQVRAELELKSAYSQMKLINRKLHEHANELEIAKEKAEESDQLKTAFLANISHEIRTPMNGIVGFAQLTMNPGLTEEKRNTYLQIITDSTMQLESVVMDIIDLSKIEGGEAKFNKKEVDTEDIIKSAFELNKSAARDKRLEYDYEKRSINQPIQTNKTRFKQVINILLNNAIKFTSEGGVSLNWTIKQNIIEINVIDTGIGIAVEDQEIIFEPFRQVEIAMKRKFGGTGLGLTIAKKIAQTLGGEISVTSEIDKGSKFTFIHPLK